MLDELQDSASGEGPFGSVSLDDLLQTALERDPGASTWEQAGPANKSPPVPSSPSATCPDLRGQSVEEVWHAIHASPAHAATAVGHPPQQQGLVREAAQTDQSLHSSTFQPFHGMRASDDASHQPDNHENAHVEAEQEPAAQPSYPRSSQHQSSAMQHPSLTMSMPMLPPLQVPACIANGNSKTSADPAAWVTGAGAQGQSNAARHGPGSKATRKAVPQESQPESQASPAAKVFCPMTPSSPEAQQPDWPLGTEMPAARAGRQRKRKASEDPSGDERQTKRMVKNRESAARSRLRKQAYTIDLESQVEDLRRENKDLLEKVIKACPPPDPKHMPTVDGEALRRTRTTPM
ncbi:hypothetical protein WJX74_006673 [Apatococcus lobatus]|uniref:BZIP domain-containing protein n=1 Tax=Apatococcus lobatus TaxID=904363 RepID=A0AAW1QN41_9CHLO